jgi:uncharacterized protein (TIGR02246 family)
MTDAAVATTDEAAIRDILDGEEDAWNRGDAAGYSQHIAQDCIATNVQGQAMSGKDLFLRQHSRIFATLFTGTTLTQSIVAFRFLGPDVAVVESLCTVTGLASPPPFLPLDAEGRLQTRLLHVLEKTGDHWSTVVYHNTTINHRAPPLAA